VLRTEAVVDLAAIRANVSRLKAGTNAEVLAVVKADGYGHGLVPAAQAAVAGGATWLGTAIVDEAVALRTAGLTVPVLAWLWTPDETATVRAAIAMIVAPAAAGRLAKASATKPARLAKRRAQHRRS